METEFRKDNDNDTGILKIETADIKLAGCHLAGHKHLFSQYCLFD